MERAAGALLAAELRAPLLLLCGLCCSSDSSSDTSSTGKHPQKPIISRERYGSGSGAGLARRARPAGSAASLHLPGPSGHARQLLSAHRSHEEIPRRRSQLAPAGAQGEGEGEGEEGRYHSAPSVIAEVLHRRLWERSSRDLHIPLRPDAALCGSDSDDSQSSGAAPPHSPAGRAPPPRCKKHHTNIKSSRNRTEKEAVQDDVKDTDATERESGGSFYIGEDSTMRVDTASEEQVRSVYRAKEAKQSLNECIKREAHRVEPAPRARASLLLACATPHSPTPPPLSVEAVGYEGGACYLAETGELGALRGPVGALRGPVGALSDARGATGRARHASDGDILAPAARPESGAFSESDLELELELELEERPPAYSELEAARVSRRKETAI